MDKESEEPKHYSYCDAVNFLFEKESISPITREVEFDIWAYLDYNNVQPYLDKELTQKTTAKECNSSGITLSACYFSRDQINSFDPDSNNNTGRWITFQDLSLRWLRISQNKSLEAINDLIVSTHNKTINNNRFLLHPAAPDDELFAVDPITDIAKKPQEGMFQLRQVERFEKQFFSSKSMNLTPPESIGYEDAFQSLHANYECSREEFTVWCHWNRWELSPYLDSALTRPLSFWKEEVNSLSTCLLGTYFNKKQIETFTPTNRYLTYEELVTRIVNVSNYSQEEAKQLIANKFNYDKGKEEKPDALSESNTLGMEWTFRFNSPSPETAVFCADKVESFISSSFNTSSSPTDMLTTEQFVSPDDPPHGKRQEQQREAILAGIRARGLDPKKLPMVPNGNPSIKADLRKELSNLAIFSAPSSFNKAWEQLSQFEDIAFSESEPPFPPK
ncbi:hypothetical protein [Ketobacter sp.]|uniref:hypothetical protein n=1 Tax=Ketobacter sp. TaxID=2083498 RepID=UPI000F12873A|nr:hypothetical protein [Ketobacter sp.]RLU00599.1 MAG: hypothetical protein D9N14_04855 [Ketobacter sp.]